VAEDVASGPARLETATARPARAERALQSSYYFRFTLAYTVLAVIATAGVAALVIVLTRPDVVPAAPWSTFVPTGSPGAKVRQIATQVSGEYKLSTKSKLVTVVPSPLQWTRFLQTDSGPVSVEIPVSTIAVQADTSTGKHEPGDVTTFDANSTVAYQMCGFGTANQNCAIQTTAPAAVRSAVLRREALELALYTLKYVPSVNAVVTYLAPPPATSQASPTAVLVVRKDVERNLHRPLARTLTPRRLLVGETAPDQGRVNDLTLPRLYTYDYQSLPGDSTAVLVLAAAITGR
jgi:hypothetical protein